MKKVRFLGLILLVLILSACGVFGLRTFNEDGSEASPFSFEYPLGWEVLYDNESTWAFQNAEDIEIKDGRLQGFFLGTIGVGMGILTPEILIEEYGTTENTPAEIMDLKYQESVAMWEAFQSGDQEEFDELTGMVSLTERPAILVPDVYESPTTLQICDKEIVIMKVQDYSTFVQFSPYWKRWWGMTVIDNQVIQIIALADRADEERFEEIFESIICSLEVHESE
ncbi:MAG: hypothetical protein H6657_31360 [Ardenticatenaceae bacterium]|nr:hypothetical protein [Ardenticatenaceae bacterium]